MRISEVLAIGAGVVSAVFAGSSALAQDSNACPVDGCVIKIASATAEGGELSLVFDANFSPDMSKNHIHVWWGENYTVEQVSNDAETVHGVKQGDWHPTADYPGYVTTGAASVAARDAATTICVSAADRNHDILDTALVSCTSVADLLAD